MVYGLGCIESTESNWDTFRPLGQWRLIHGQLVVCEIYSVQFYLEGVPIV